MLRPELMRLRVDILCLQEVNGKRAARRRERQLSALSALISGTPYAACQLVSTQTADGRPAERHNLVILSRLPIISCAQIRHDLVERPLYRPATARPRSDRPEPVEWERPLLHVEIAVGATSLHVINLHLCAPLAAPVAGQKFAPFSWHTAGGWAEGFFLAGIKRAGQALDARLLTDRLLDDDPDALVVVAGTSTQKSMRCRSGSCGRNSETSAMPLCRLVRCFRSKRSCPKRNASRCSITADASCSTTCSSVRSYEPTLTRAETLNQGLADEVDAGEQGAMGGLFHAPLVAEFALPSGR